ncbi:uncharacterized protein METZ01_LOCUS56783 [marine metagenome]|uniref:DUF1015 domain-containing protein n=1 Tax=marine metagenome TaxID=408172 RepID=A0A381SKF1_9ZZZZ
MIDIRPFKGTRPFNEEAKNLIAPSTDHLNEQHLIDIHEKHYWNYLKILNPVGQLKETDTLKAAKGHFDEMKNNHIIKQDDSVCFYIYKIKFNNHIQTGFLAVANIRDFIDNKIKGHELTYESRLKERADQMLNIETQIGPIYVSYIDENGLDNLINDLTKSSPDYDFESFDKSHHTLWCIQNPEQINQLSRSINSISSLYIADGHHRIGAMKKISEINESFNYFMIAAFPKSQSKIFDYNRVIKDLNGLSVSEFIKKIEDFFYCKRQSTSFRPKKIKEFGMYHHNQWYSLNFKKKELLDDNILSNLDINILNQYCLKPILGIQDVNNDERIRFIAGCHGLEALEKKVNDNPDSVAFSLFPTHIDDVIEVANQNLTMPPKTTWFDPKPLDGLVVYEFNQ